MMKIIVFGKRAAMSRVISFLSGQGADLSIVTPDSLEKLADLLETGLFDMAIVQADPATARSAFVQLDELRIPVIFITGSQASEWQSLRRLNAYAYIPETAAGRELNARLRAVCRRLNRAGENRGKSAGNTGALAALLTGTLL